MNVCEEDVKMCIKKINLRSKTLSHKWLAAVTTHTKAESQVLLSPRFAVTHFLPTERPIKKAPYKHKNTIFQCLNQFGVRASHWNTHHPLTSLSLPLCHFIRFFSSSHSFSSSYPHLSPSPPVLDPICCSSCLYMSLPHCSALTQKRSF